MSEVPDSSALTNEKKAAPASESEAAKVTDSDSGQVPGEIDAVAPATETPEAYLRLKSYCEGFGLKTAIELDEPFSFISIDFKNGRSIRTAYIGTEEAANALLQFPIEEIVFLGDYSAICSYKGGWIEAAVRAHGGGSSVSIARRTLFGKAATVRDEPQEVKIPGTTGLTLTLSEKKGLLYWLDYGAQIYLRIDGIGITEHDNAVNLLEDLSNSLFMQIDFRFDSSLTLGRDRPARVNDLETHVQGI